MHKEDSGAAVIDDTLYMFRNRRQIEMEEDIELLKKNMIGKTEAELDE